jgi:hypothetical protein
MITRLVPRLAGYPQSEEMSGKQTMGVWASAAGQIGETIRQPRDR